MGPTDEQEVGVFQFQPRKARKLAAPAPIIVLWVLVIVGTGRGGRPSLPSDCSTPSGTLHWISALGCARHWSRMTGPVCV
jgi:hypothetical protein